MAGGATRSVSLLGAVVGLAAVVVLVVGLRGLPMPGPGASSSSVPGPSTTTGSQAARTFALPGSPATLAADADGALVVLRDGRLVRVSRGGAVAVLADIGAEPCGVPLSTGEALYVAACDAKVRRVDASTGEVAAFPGSGRQLAAGSDGGVWMLDADRRNAVLVDGRTGSVRVTVDLNAFAAGAVAGFGRIWIVGEGNSRLTALDPGTGEILAVVELGHEPGFGLAASDVIYAVSADSQVVDVVDPETGAVARTLAGSPLLATSLTVGVEGIWVGGAGEDRLLDPASGSVLRTVPTAGTAWVAGGTDGVWVAATDASELTLLEP